MAVIRDPEGEAASAAHAAEAGWTHVEAATTGMIEASTYTTGSQPAAAT